MTKNNPYGYKVGYRENGNRPFIRYFTTYTYRQALFLRRFYQKYPQRNRDNNRILIDPVWEIQPITKKEIMRSILDEIPFLITPCIFLCSAWLSLHRENPKVNAKKFLFFFLICRTSQQFFRNPVDFRATLNAYMVRSYSLYATSPLPRKANIKKQRRKKENMYKENFYKTFNVWRDGDVLHIFLTVPQKQYKQYKMTVLYVKNILGLNFDLEYDDDQFYFVLSDFDEYKEFKEYFFRYLCRFEKEND